MELCFDILDDLSDELEISDYFVFVMINEISSELIYGIIRRVEYYYQIYDDHYLFVGHDEILHTVSEVVCYFGDLDVLKWLHRNGKINNKYRLLSSACLGENLEIMEWLHDEYGIRNFYYAIRCACREGYLDILKWLFDKRLLGDIDDDRFCIRYACYNGHLDVVKWMHEYKRVSLPNISTDYKCEIHCDVVKYMIEIGLCKRKHVVGWVRRGGSKDVLLLFG